MVAVLDGDLWRYDVIALRLRLQTGCSIADANSSLAASHTAGGPLSDYII